MRKAHHSGLRKNLQKIADQDCLKGLCVRKRLQHCISNALAANHEAQTQSESVPASLREHWDHNRDTSLRSMASNVQDWPAKIFSQWLTDWAWSWALQSLPSLTNTIVVLLSHKVCTAMIRSHKCGLDRTPSKARRPIYSNLHRDLKRQESKIVVACCFMSVIALDQ